MRRPQFIKQLTHGKSWNKTVLNVLICAVVCAVPIKASIFNSASTQEPSNTSAQGTETKEDVAHMRETIRRLTAEVERLKRKLATNEQNRHISTIQDHLQKDEQRATDLQAQLLVIAEKETSAQARMDQIDLELQPGNIDNMQTGGSLRPEEVRAATRHRLTNEKHRVQSQLDLLRQGRIRIESSLADTDMAIQRLKMQLQEASITQ
jgi:hypothetical protein